MHDFLETLIYIVSGCMVGIGAWLIRLGKRVAVLESQGQDVHRRLDRIEKKIDQLIERK